MIRIGNYLITSYDDNMLVEMYGISYERSPRLENRLAYIMELPDEIFFSDQEDLRNRLFPMPNAGSYLYLDPMYLHPRFRKPIWIHMSGSRGQDEVSSNKEIWPYSKPANFTWHHAEGIRWQNGWECRMYLVWSEYHNTTKHRGGVVEYAERSGREYRD